MSSVEVAQVMKSKPVICPACGSRNNTGYFYGKPEEYDDALKIMTKNPPLYGGDNMTPETPMYHCRDCRHDWNIPHKFPFGAEEPKKARRVCCVVDDMPSLTKGKIYEVQSMENGAYGIIDDEYEGVYLYNPACFEIVDDGYRYDYSPDFLPDDIAEYEECEIYDPPYFLHDGYVLSPRFDFGRVLSEAQDGSENARWGVINYILYAWDGITRMPENVDLKRVYYECLLGSVHDENGCEPYGLLGHAVLKGIGCEPDEKEALRWFKKALEAGEELPDEVMDFIEDNETA